MAFTPVALSENLAAEVVATLPAIGTHARDLLFRHDNCALTVMQRNEKTVAGGRDIREPIIVQADESVKRLSGAMDNAPLIGFEPLMQWREVWRAYGKVLVIDEDQLDDNSGAEKILDILKIKRDVAVENMRKTINGDLLSATQVTDGLNSLHVAINDSPSTSPNPRHGYDPASYTFARNIQVTGGSFATGVAENAIKEGMYTAKKAQGVGGIKRFISSLTTFVNYQKSLTPMQTIVLTGGKQEPQNIGEGSFMGIPWTYDLQYSDNTTLIGIDPAGCQIYTKGKGMSFGKPMDVVDQWFMAWKMKMRLQLMVCEPPRQMKITGLSA